MHCRMGDDEMSHDLWVYDSDIFKNRNKYNSI